MIKTGKKEKSIAAMFLLVAIYISWRLLLAAAVSFADCDDGECDWQQFAGTAVIGRVGDRRTIMPMIGILAKTEYDNGFTENLLRLHRRYNLGREPYVGEIVAAALNGETESDNRKFMVELLRKITGERLGCVGNEANCDEAGFEGRETDATRDIREWWNKRQAAGKK